MVFARDRSDAPLEQAVRRKGARIIASLEAADDAWQGIDGARVKRVRDGCDALRFEIGDCLCDLVAEFDAADALIALLNSCGLAVDLDLEPDPADAGGLHRKVTRLARDSCIRHIA